MVSQYMGQKKDFNSDKIKIAVVGGALAATLAVGGTLAYLTATDSITNSLSLDTNLSISLKEPSFAEESAKNLLPTQAVAKDPTITNDGSVDAYIAAVVKVPLFDGKVITEAGKTDVTQSDLFTYELGEGWTKFGESKIEDGYRINTYVYDSQLKSQQSTSPIFSEIVTANLASSIENNEVTVDVDAFAIQSYGFDSAADAYSAYLSQETEAVKAA